MKTIFKGLSLTSVLILSGCNQTEIETPLYAQPKRKINAQSMGRYIGPANSGSVYTNPSMAEFNIPGRSLKSLGQQAYNPMNMNGQLSPWAYLPPPSGAVASPTSSHTPYQPPMNPAMGQMGQSPQAFSAPPMGGGMGTPPVYQSTPPMNTGGMPPMPVGGGNPYGSPTVEQLENNGIMIPPMPGGGGMGGAGMPPSFPSPTPYGNGGGAGMMPMPPSQQYAPMQQPQMQNPYSPQGYNNTPAWKNPNEVPVHLSAINLPYSNNDAYVAPQNNYNIAYNNIPQQQQQLYQQIANLSDSNMPIVATAAIQEVDDIQHIPGMQYENPSAEFSNRLQKAVDLEKPISNEPYTQLSANDHNVSAEEVNNLFEFFEDAPEARAATYNNAPDINQVQAAAPIVEVENIERLQYPSTPSNNYQQIAAKTPSNGYYGQQRAHLNSNNHVNNGGSTAIRPQAITIPTPASAPRSFQVSPIEAKNIAINGNKNYNNKNIIIERKYNPPVISTNPYVTNRPASYNFHSSKNVAPSNSGRVTNLGWRNAPTNQAPSQAHISTSTENFQYTNQKPKSLIMKKAIKREVVNQNNNFRYKPTPYNNHSIAPKQNRVTSGYPKSMSKI